MTLPSGIKKVVIPLGFLFLFVAIWYGLFKPEYEKISRYRQQPLAARAQIEKMVQQLNNFNRPTKEERAEWTQLEDEINKRLPRGKQISELYAHLSALAEEFGLADFQRRELPESEKVLEDNGIKRNGFSIELNFESSYSSLAGFISGLHRLERLTEIVNFRVVRDLPLVKVTLVLRSYYVP